MGASPHREPSERWSSRRAPPPARALALQLMENAHELSVGEILERFNVDPSQGLTDAQVLASRLAHGPNELPPDPPTPLWRRLLAQFDDLLVRILVAAAAVDLLISWANGELGSRSALVEPGVIALILVANAAVGVATEANAERALEALREYEAGEALVVRNGGRKRTVPARDLVPGDVVEVAVGDRVPADLRLISTGHRHHRHRGQSRSSPDANPRGSGALLDKAFTVGQSDTNGIRCDGDSFGGGEVRVDQSILTGESDSVAKAPSASPVKSGGGGGGGQLFRPPSPPSFGDAAGASAAASSPSTTISVTAHRAVAQDKTCILFSGTTVTAGRGRGVVVGTGSSTAIGAVRAALADAAESSADAPTPLKQKLDEFGEVLSKIIAAVCVLVWVVNVPRFKDAKHGGTWLGGALYYFKIAVALAVAAIPEGLPAVVTTCLALGTRAMAKRNAIVRSLPAVETLGCTTVICSDKTGTLTTNQMVACKVLMVSGESGGGDPEQLPLSSSSASASKSAPSLVFEVDVSGSSFSPRGELTDASTGAPLSASSSRSSTPASASPALAALAACAALCNDAELEEESGGSVRRVGEATEAALRALAEKVGLPSPGSRLFAADAAPESVASPSTESSGGGNKGSQGKLTPANDAWRASQSRVACLEFDRERKMMSVLTSSSSYSACSPLTLWVKGAPEVVLARCSSVLPCSPALAPPPPSSSSSSSAPPPRPVPLTPAARASIAARAEFLAGDRALRWLALAYREMKPAGATGAGGTTTPPPSISPSGSRQQQRHPRPPLLSASDESQLVLLGLVGLHDPPRPEARPAVAACQAAGVRVVMVTGDAAPTAEAVARAVGILQPPSLLPPTSPSSSPSNPASSPYPLCMTGAEFASLPADEAEEAASRVAVLSRVEPAHKALLVSALQRRGVGGSARNRRGVRRGGGDDILISEVVAVTGDGVNDAPALRAADVGVAMGGGTAVARAAADVVLADDNFATVVDAVALGRSIYANTKQFIRYMVSSNVGEVVAIFAGAALGLPEVLSPVQLLWVNLVTDGLPATALGANPPDPRAMARPPRGRADAVVDGWLLVRYLAVGAYVGAATAAGFVWWFVSYDGGPRMEWGSLVGGHSLCPRSTTSTTTIATSSSTASASSASSSAACAALDAKEPRTVAVSVLVLVEMFNALNALSEDGSLFLPGGTPPTSNPWLLAAVALSLALHAMILYVPALAGVFGTAPLGRGEWTAVFLLSAPVILLDEVLKAYSRTRRLNQRSRSRRSGSRPEEFDVGVGAPSFPSSSPPPPSSSLPLALVAKILPRPLARSLAGSSLLPERWRRSLSSAVAREAELLPLAARGGEKEREQ